MDTQVAVVGAGPVGLMLAAELRLGGAQVVVLEALESPSTESRASTVHARTMEILDQRGLLEPLGSPPCETLGHYGGIPLDFGASASAYAGLWKVPQARIEQVLGERALELGARVLRGRRVVGLESVGEQVRLEVDGPDGPTHLTAGHVVGCDGEESIVRRLGGFGFPGIDASRGMLRCDVRGVQVRDRRFERLDRGLAIASTRNGVTRVMVHEFGAEPPKPGRAPRFEDVVGAWLTVAGEDLGGGEPLWVNAFDDANRQADAYVRGRLLLAGDAAHRQMPVGGQALNLGLQDAVNLGWKLAAQAGGRAPAGLLASYHTERHAVGAAVLANIAAQSLLLLGGHEVDALRTLLRELLAQPAVRDRLVAAVSGLDVEYPGAAGSDPLAGRRWMPAWTHGTEPGGADPVLEALRSGRGALLELTGDPESERRTAGLAAPWGSRVAVASAVAAEGSAAAGRALVLLRPDGHVAWSGATGADPGAALHGWFGDRD